jgi:hypothetical protein
MCFLEKCSKCNKYTWYGCGRHVTDISKNITDNNKCKCDPNKWDNKK